MKNIASVVAATVFAMSLLFCGTASAQQSGFSGKVAETTNGGGYTYVLVNTGTNKVWAAANQFPVKMGDTVATSDAMLMNDFHSKALNRDFAAIYFVGNLTVNGANPNAPKLPPGHPAIGAGATTTGDLPPGHPALPGKMETPKIDFTGLQPAKGGKTVADVYASSASLAGQSVTIRGKVVKYNADILGKNWIHIQDGTGTAPGNDLLVTSTVATKVGDTVLVTGKVALNQDFGGGYKYAVMIEGERLTVE